MRIGTDANASALSDHAARVEVLVMKRHATDEIPRRLCAYSCAIGKPSQPLNQWPCCFRCCFLFKFQVKLNAGNSMITRGVVLRPLGFTVRPLCRSGHSPARAVVKHPQSVRQMVSPPSICSSGTVLHAAPKVPFPISFAIYNRVCGRVYSGFQASARGVAAREDVENTHSRRAPVGRNGVPNKTVADEIAPVPVIVCVIAAPVP